MASTRELVRIRQEPLGNLCRHFEWSEKAAGFVTPNATVMTCMQSLINHKYWFDAATLLAHALPKREAIWWTTVVIEHYLPMASADTESLERQALEAIKHWIITPEESQRMAAHAAGQPAGNRLPAYWATMAVFWSTGNITPEVGVITPPPPFLYARAVAACVDVAASLTTTQRDINYERWLDMGLTIAEGKNPTHVVTSA